MTTPDAAAVALVARLSDPAMKWPASDFPRDRSSVANAGLYSWWVDDDGLKAVSAPFGVALPRLIYAGQAGATSSRSGKESSATLGSRIEGNHLNGNVGSSTFRETLTAVLLNPLGLSLVGPRRLVDSSNRAVSAWMREHLSIVIAPYPDRATLGAAEHAVLQKLDPPLNLSGMPNTPIRVRLRELRGVLRRPTCSTASRG